MKTFVIRIPGVTRSIEVGSVYAMGDKRIYVQSIESVDTSPSGTIVTVMGKEVKGDEH